MPAALFIDLEHLLASPGDAGGPVPPALLEGALASMRQALDGEPPAVGRAYADWAEPRWRPLLPVLAAAGVAPMQVAPWPGGTTRQAAEAQLVVEAMGCLHERPHLATFLLAGDAGLGPLATRLREHGKRVLLGASRAPSPVSWPGAWDELLGPASPGEPGARPLATVPPAPVAAGPVGPRTVTSLFELRRAGDEVAYELQAWLYRPGSHLDIAAAQARLADHVQDLAPQRFGFSRFVELARWMLAGHPLGVFRRLDASLVVARRDAQLEQAELQPDFLEADLHDEAAYRRILAHGPRAIHLPVAAELDRHRASETAARRKARAVMLHAPDGAEELTQFLATLRAHGLALAAATGVGVLLEPGCSLDEALDVLERQAGERLTAVLGGYEEAVLGRLCRPPVVAPAPAPGEAAGLARGGPARRDAWGPPTSLHEVQVPRFS
ncbi:MAG: NYN domain-containing protein [Candidatus Sericytochromatia bacterium]|nr:NYN domain-containing protein [Candidatus Sericytochromatia bacterium]